MKNRNPWIIVAISALVIGLVIIILTLIEVSTADDFTWFGELDNSIAANIATFISGFAGVLFSAAGVILIYATFKEQQKLINKQHFENQFFSLLNTYHDIVKNTSGEVLAYDRTKTKALLTNNLTGKLFLNKLVVNLKNETFFDDFKSFFKEKGKQTNKAVSYSNTELSYIGFDVSFTNDELVYDV